MTKYEPETKTTMKANFQQYWDEDHSDAEDESKHRSDKGPDYPEISCFRSGLRRTPEAGTPEAGISGVNPDPKWVTPENPGGGQTQIWVCHILKCVWGLDYGIV
eukprot:CAMPEP_0201138886 /NCGR_PEP_ID=MMETSP0850-20130426/56162_1 /ASSEMBLY_ACC=CAM_ASM_000622 /TAXON_ID=183588 /ORGANISM="Pseudo-nitzschia fraudulenta, Strain WWA7" /LENGTH=103 /DNA_ID=CAMNT_0047410297 /DNA_START=205 /DNA_END=517 /DNA_ORIENTATION=+